jgi:integrase
MATRRWKPLKRINPVSGKTRWVARWKDKTGKIRVGWKPDIPGTYRLEREAQAAIDKCLERDAQGPARTDTIGAYFTDWTRTHPRARHTNMTNESRVRAVLDVELDGIRFRDWTFEALRRRHANLIKDHLLAEGRAYTGVNAILGTLGAMVEDAIEDEVAVQNPFRGMKKIKANDPRIVKGKRKVRVFSWQEMHSFARACADVEKGSPDLVAWRRVYAEPMVRMLSDCGLRIGELFPLCLSDVSFSDGTLRVGWSVSAGEVLPGTKCDHGEVNAGRVVPVPPDLLRMLDGMPKDTITLRGGVRERLLFPSLSGRVWDHATFRRLVWLPGAAASDVVIRPHELRHSHISLLRAAGVDPADLAEMSGHTVETQTKAYTHALGRSFEAARKAVGE